MTRGPRLRGSRLPGRGALRERAVRLGQREQATRRRQLEQGEAVKVRPQLAEVRDRFPLRGLSADEAEALLLLGVPAEAVRLGRGLLLGYRRDDDSQEKTREVAPLGLVNKAGTWYLVALAPRPRGAGEDRGPVVFRAGRVTSARLLADGVARPDGFDLAAFWAGWSAAFVTGRSQVEVRVWATATALAIFPFVFGDAGRRAAEAAGPAGQDGRREVLLTFEEERVAAHRLAGFGGEVEVISPAAVRAELVATARGLLGRYRDLPVRPRSPARGREVIIRTGSCFAGRVPPRLAGWWRVRASRNRSEYS
jgi:predicted DNA-binding transcriptional regulator YafY